MEHSRGVHEFWTNGGETHVLLVNVRPSVREHKPSQVVHKSFCGQTTERP